LAAHLAVTPRHSSSKRFESSVRYASKSSAAFIIQLRRMRTEAAWRFGLLCRTDNWSRASSLRRRSTPPSMGVAGRAILLSARGFSPAQKPGSISRAF